MTTQPAGEHHTGTLALSGQGNAPASPISDEMAELAAVHMTSVARIYYGPQVDAPHMARKFARAALEAAYPAIRQQVAEEIAAKCLRRAQLAERVPEGERSGVREGMVVTWLAAEKLAREVADG